MKRAVITGASGFIGKALTNRLLADSWTVYAVVRDPSKLEQRDGLCVVQAAMSEYDRLETLIPERGMDAFFHMAWDGTFGDSFLDHHRQMKNAAYAADALMAAVQLKAKRFVYIGTIVELEAMHYICGSDEQPRISCIYGAAKAAGEMICRALAARNGIAFNVAILARNYGEGDRSRTIQNVLISALLRGESPKLIDGRQLYDWVYIDDVVSALITIAEKGRENKAYYVGHAELKTFRELVMRTRDIIAPDVELDFGSLAEKTVMDWSRVDRTALYRDTGFLCTADFDESIRKTAKWLAAQSAAM